MTQSLPSGLLHQLLSETDRFAVETVRAGQGGPFGSSIHVLDHDTGGVTAIGQPSGNAVLAKGMGGAHAESENLCPETIRLLKEHLHARRGDNLYVIHSSSGESCPACAAKEEILAQHLDAEGLLPKGRYIVTYGATYEMTRDVASFNDLTYMLDMQKGPGRGAIPIREGVRKAPADVIQLITRAIENETRIAVLALADGRIFVGNDDRDTDLMQTAETHAIRQAGAWQKAHTDMAMPWLLSGAVLYTMCPPDQIGPLTLSECLWSDVARVNAVWDERMKDLPYQEASHMTNAQFYRDLLARPYNGGDSFVTVLHLPEHFENQAQLVWRDEVLATAENLGSVLYNGADLDQPSPK